MSIYFTFLLCLGIYGLLNSYFLPRVETAWANSKGFQKFAKIRTLAALKTSRGITAKKEKPFARDQFGIAICPSVN